MEKRIIVSGIPKVVDHILKENRVREKRGEVVFRSTDELERELKQREEAVAAREEELKKLEAELAERKKVESKKRRVEEL